MYPGNAASEITTVHCTKLPNYQITNTMINTQYMNWVKLTLEVDY